MGGLARLKGPAAGRRSQGAAARCEKIRPDFDEAQCLNARPRAADFVEPRLAAGRGARLAARRFAPFRHSSLLARRAPSTSASSFAHMICGCTRAKYVTCAKPQSVLAITFSLPTSRARRTM